MTSHGAFQTHSSSCVDVMVIWNSAKATECWNIIFFLFISLNSLYSCSRDFFLYTYKKKGGTRQPPPPPYREPPRPSPLGGGGRGSSPYRSSPAPPMTPSPGRSTSTPPRPSPVRHEMNVQQSDETVPTSSFDSRDDQSRRSRRNLRLVNTIWQVFLFFSHIFKLSIYSEDEESFFFFWCV